jgi:hypothetical protein
MRTAFLCDDDNDLALAARVGRAFVPTVGSESMRLAVEQGRRRVAAEPGAQPRFVTPQQASPPPPGSAAVQSAAATEAMVTAATVYLCEVDDDEQEERGRKDGVGEEPEGPTQGSVGPRAGSRVGAAAR